MLSELVGSQLDPDRQALHHLDPVAGGVKFHGKVVGLSMKAKINLTCKE